MKLLFPILLSFIGLDCTGWHITSNSTYEEQVAKRLLHRTMVALDRALAFCYEEIPNLIFDSIMGLSLCEGQLTVLLNNIENGLYPNVTSDIKTRIRYIIRNATKIGEAALPYVRADDESAAKLEGMLEKGFWLLYYPNRKTDPSLITPRLYPDDQQEGSDGCYAALLAGRCKPSRFCEEMMLREGYTGYDLTHSLLYLEIAEAAGCLNAAALKNTDKLVNNYCANILKEAIDLDRTGLPDAYGQDLFIEQQALCGMVGFRDFFRPEWLIQILQWQWPQGCYGDEKEIPRDRPRVKRDEKTLRDGCQAHITSVAIAALTQYVRYILDFLYKTPNLL